eukprot:m51a1_g1164 hypothetical protein (319) ;mRNA; f:352752-353708
MDGVWGQLGSSGDGMPVPDEYAIEHTLLSVPPPDPSDDVLRSILALLSPADLSLSCALVCSSWRRAAYCCPLWRRLCAQRHVCPPGDPPQGSAVCREALWREAWAQNESSSRSAADPERFWSAVACALDELSAQGVGRWCAPSAVRARDYDTRFAPTLGARERAFVRALGGRARKAHGVCSFLGHRGIVLELRRGETVRGGPVGLRVDTLARAAAVAVVFAWAHEWGPGAIAGEPTCRFADVEEAFLTGSGYFVDEWDDDGVLGGDDDAPSTFAGLVVPQAELVDRACEEIVLVAAASRTRFWAFFASDTSSAVSDTV